MNDMVDDFENCLHLKDANYEWKQKFLDALQELEDKISLPASEENTCDLQENKQETEVKLKMIQKEISDLTKQIKEIEETTEENSSIRPELALYELITKLRWDLDSPEKELKGFVAGNPLKVFNLDVTKHSEQEIVDYLWKLIDPQSL